MSTKEQYWKYSLIVIILFMGVIIFRQITPFLGGLLGALTIYILVRGQMNHLVEKRKHQRTVDYRRNDFRLSYPFGVDCLDGGKQVTGYQSGSTDLYCTYSTGSRIHQRENRIRCIGKRYAVIHHVHTSPYRTNYNGKHQQPCHQSVCHGIRTILYADRRKKNGGLCE